MSIAQAPAGDEPRTAAQLFAEYRTQPGYAPLFLVGDALAVLDELPADAIDCCMTSPPYWGQRSYAEGGIGLESDYREYVAKLTAVCGKLKRVLKPTGSFWLNIGDAYQNKNLLGIPWRVAFALTDQQGW